MVDTSLSNTGIKIVDPTIPQEPPPVPPEHQSDTFVISDLPGMNTPGVVSASPSTSSAPPTKPDIFPEMPSSPASTPPSTPPFASSPPSALYSSSPPAEPAYPSSAPAYPTSPPPPPSPEPAYSPPPQPPPETVIIPAAGSDSQFIPQGLVSPDPISGDGTPPLSTVPPIPPPKRGGGFIKTFLLFFLFLLLIGGIVAGGYVGLQYLNKDKEATITYWGLWENDAIMAPVIAQFQAQNPKIKVQYVKQSYQQYRERLQAAIERGEGPDVFRFHETWIPMLKNDIQPVPSTVMSPSEFTSMFYKIASQDLLAGSTLWGIPMMVEGLGLYVNEDLFSTAGVSPPQTYEDLINVVPRLTVKNGDAIVTSAVALGTTNNVENFSDIVALMILQNGGKLTNPTGSETEEALVFYRKFATSSDPLYTWNETMDNSIVAFANGRVAMILAPSWRAFDIKAINPNLHFHVEPVPQLPGNTVTWASYWVEGVSSKTKHRDQAFAFLKYLTSKEAVTATYTQESKDRLFGEPYALVELGNSIASDPFIGAFITQAPNAKSFPLASNTHDNGINDRMIKYMEDAINTTVGGVAPSQALSTMAQGFQQVLTSYGLAVSAP